LDNSTTLAALSPSFLFLSSATASGVTPNQASALSFPLWQSMRGAFDPDKQKWELYHIDEDFSQANDVAAANPGKLRQLQDLWWAEAARYNVLPLDWRATERFDSELMGRPSLIAGRKKLVYYPGVVGLPLSSSPPLLNKSWTITADIELPEGEGSGMIVTEGGLEGGIEEAQGQPILRFDPAVSLSPERGHLLRAC
jgi:hypothetical protein